MSVLVNLLRKMANAWLLVCTILMTVNAVFGNDCSSMLGMKSCDDCIRCGGNWCNDPDPNGNSGCADVATDSWCPRHKEHLDSARDRTDIGSPGKPTYREKTVQLGVQSVISYENIEPKVRVVNTTQNAQELTYRTARFGGAGNWYVETTPGVGFCTAKSKGLEEFYMEIEIGDVKEIVKYYVPCSCPCSLRAEVFSRKCSNRGTYSCGVCSCPSGWSGKFCEKKECQGIRGDLQCTNPAMNDVECSGNGVCGPCETCECYTDRPGSKYFDRENYCADICMTTNDCDECLSNPALGHCNECHFPLIKVPYNETMMAERDSSNRSVWISCNGTVDDCHIEYAAMKTDNKDVYVMVVKLCNSNNEAAVAGAVNVTIPIVVTVVLAVAAAMATAGYLMWKGRPPPLPLADTQYQNIGPEDCVGSNPLYKPPNSYYNNPTYGKN